MRMKFFGYSVLELGINAIDIFLKLYLLFFYTEKRGIEIYYVSLVLGIATLIDILAAPLIGLYIDKYRTKFLQRYYLIGFGLAGTCLFLFLLFNPPVLEREIFDLVYLLMVYLLYSLFFSLMGISYSSSINDISSTSEEREKFLVWKNILGSFGGVLAIGLPGIFLLYDSSNAFYYTSTAFIAVMILCFLITQPTLKKHNIRKEPHKNIKATFETIYKRLRESFLIIYLMSFFLVSLAANLSYALGFYFYRYLNHFNEQEVQTLMAVALISSMIFLPVAYYLFKKINKFSLSATLMVILGILNSILILWMPDRNIIAAMGFSSITGTLLFVSKYYLEVTLIDFIVKKEEQSGQDRMGFYYSLWKMVQKVSIIVSIFVMVLLIGDKAPESIISYLYGPGVGLLFVFAGALLFLLPKRLVQQFNKS